MNENERRRQALQRAFERAPITKKEFAEYCGLSASYIYTMTGRGLVASGILVSDRVWLAAQKFLGEYLNVE